MYNVRLIKAKTNAQNGLTTVNVRAETAVGNNTVVGPEKGYAIDADTLAAHWDGDVKKWLVHIKAEHQRYHGIHVTMGEDLKELEGKLI